jgi:hypothetical protein
MTRKTPTAELLTQILASIRSGGYAHVAAAAWGVSEADWREWNRRAAKRRGGKAYREFFLKVEQAEGQARLKAELDAREADPRFWLKHGPGKDRPDSPGWSAMARAPRRRRKALANLFAVPEFLRLLAGLRQALAPHPEALADVTRILEAFDSGEKS